MSAIGEASPRHVGFAPIQVAQIPKCELGAVSCTYAVSARMGEREGENASMISQWEGQEKLEGQEKQREGMNMAGGGAGGQAVRRRRRGLACAHRVQGAGGALCEDGVRDEGRGK